MRHVFTDLMYVLSNRALSERWARTKNLRADWNNGPPSGATIAVTKKEIADVHLSNSVPGKPDLSSPFGKEELIVSIVLIV